MSRILLSILVLIHLSCNSAESSAASGGKLYLRTIFWPNSGLEISWLFLGNNGMIVNNPVNGVNPVDWEKEKASNPQRVGFYKITADRIIIDWQNGTHTEWSYEKENGKISAIDGGIVTEPEALPAGYKIEGKYEGGTILPNVANNQQFFFNKDGTFILNSTGFIDVPSVATGTSSGDKKGTYQVKGNTLTLKFSNGEMGKAVITVMEFEKGEKNLVINAKYFAHRR